MEQLDRLLRTKISKQDRDRIVKQAVHDPLFFKDLLDYFYSDNARLSQNASWPIGIIGEKYPSMLTDQLPKFLEIVQDDTRHNAIRRNIMRIFQSIEIPEDMEGALYQIAIRFVEDSKEMIAVRAFSIRVCERIVERHPDMKNELLEIIKANLSHWSSGLRNRGQKFVQKWDTVQI